MRSMRSTALAEARRAAERLFREYDALLLPTVPFCPTLAEVAADPIGANSRLGTFTNFVNLCDLAAIAVPAGSAATACRSASRCSGRPGRRAGSPRSPIAFTAQSTDRVGATQHATAAAGRADALGADETALFCIGAHMSGLPLNHQLTALGGRFLRARATAPLYRLYALGNRPGMVRADRWRRDRGRGLGAADRRDRRVCWRRCRRRLASARCNWAMDPASAFWPKRPAWRARRDITEIGGWRAWLAAREEQA